MKLDLLAPLYELPGPFATAYLDTSRDAEDAARAIDLRWQALALELSNSGADDGVVDAMADRVGVHRDEAGQHGQALVAAQGQVVLDAVLPRPPVRNGARWSPLPEVLPILAQLAVRVPYVVVLASRTGADITVHSDTEEASTIEGQSYRVQKVRAGGWSQQRYERSAEDLWEKNAEQVADDVNTAVRRIGARLLVAAGDVRARGYLRDHLAAESRDVLVEVDEGARAAGAAEEPLDERVARLVAEIAARDVQGTVEQFQQERGQRDRAVEGLEATVAALQRAQVATLLVQEGNPKLDNTAWIGPQATHIALQPEQLWQMGAPEPQQDRIDSALIRAAAGTGADLVLLTEGQLDLPDGVAALTRFSDAATRL